MTLPVDLLVAGSTSPLQLRAGMTRIIVGANGSGKTKLAIECEQQLGTSAHRISAQRMLAFDPTIERIGEDAARSKLFYGHPTPGDFGAPQQARLIRRWGQGNPRFILDDAGALLQLLLAEQANVAVKALNAINEGTPVEGGETFLRKLKAIFQQVLPTRRLEFTADDITVTALTDGITGQSYSITQMSDGEKAVFYMIGQTLVASQGSIFIMDEPEIHVHRSILGRLWDELEAARPDCAFLLITHDLEFAASRTGKKYVVRRYSPSSGWVIETVPEAEGFSEDVVTLILGSRKPILFVEGEQSSLDLAFYRACYPDWTIVPRGGCEGVIHSVVTMRRNAALTRIQCAGLVDADGRDESELADLATKGIQTLPVAEIENLLLLPSVSRAILEMNDLGEEHIEAKLAELKAAVFAHATNEMNANKVVLDYCRRRIDRMLKQIDLSADKTIAELSVSYGRRTTELNVAALASEVQSKIAAAAEANDLAALLAIYDRKKPLLALAASHLRNWNIEVFSAWVTRAIQSTRDNRLREAIRPLLPELTAS